MSKFLYHTQCPKCKAEGRDKSQNNLGVYEDGSSFCFSGHGSSGSYLSRPVNAKISRLSSGSLLLPSDSSYNLSNIGLSWLSNYNLTQQEILDNKIQWSEKEQALVFPFYDTPSSLIFYQLRRFTGNKKWMSYGKKPLLYLGRSQHIAADGCVIVEDIISAIKIARTEVAVPLFGSTINKSQLLLIRKHYEKITIWLDFDKARDAEKLRGLCQCIFLEARTRITTRDPKEEIG